MRCSPPSINYWHTLKQPLVKKCLRSCCDKQLFSTQPTPKNEYKVTIPFHRLPLLVQVQAIRTMDPKDWLNEPNSSMIENAAILYQKMQNVFVFPDNLTISFYANNGGKATIRELLSNPVMKNWKNLNIFGQKVSSENLKMIMDTATSLRTLNSAVEKMPSNFKHENAFKFCNQIYNDARWVKIEDLYGLRDLIYVELRRTLFTQEQLKSLVNYWVNSEVDMFSELQIGTKSPNFKSLINGFVGLQGSGPDSKYSKLFFTLSESSLNKRKRTMLRISFNVYWRSLSLMALDINEKYTPSKNEEDNKKFENVGMILTLLHKKKELEDLLEAANEEAKMELSETIDYLISKLSEFNVTFVDGKVTHQLF
ncbi:hypothetical protein CAEBREN_15661 [Caenorhabditis brenneri]|uniref:F-box associated domain-containing protein n=1 Tax=Caenorhabditis brenneri TaxID=135651 RepID=G0N3Y0_CAEBE|nr:hypothetical protein CAEBREN_15661 [Caenorhabditis brenneri]